MHFDEPFLWLLSALLWVMDHPWITAGVAVAIPCLVVFLLRRA